MVSYDINTTQILSRDLNVDTTELKRASEPIITLNSQKTPEPTIILNSQFQINVEYILMKSKYMLFGTFKGKFMYLIYKLFL